MLRMTHFHIHLSLPHLNIFVEFEFVVLLVAIAHFRYFELCSKHSMKYMLAETPDSWKSCILVLMLMLM